MLRYLFIGVIIFFLLMYAIGFFLTPNSCIQIAECSSCWQPNNITVVSDYCPDPSVACSAEPGQQQHNAVVDTLFCACNKARAENYADATLSKRIEEVFSNFFGKQITAKELCDQSADYLVNVEYS
jgi:hypothetical protein